MKRICSILLLITMFFGGIVNVSCSDKKNGSVNDLTEIPEHLNTYFSSELLALIPDDVFMVVKSDSLSQLYDNLKISSADMTVPIEIKGKVIEKLGFNPFIKEDIVGYLGVNPDKPLILSLKEVNPNESLTIDNICIILSLPVSDIDKIKSTLSLVPVDSPEEKETNNKNKGSKETEIPIWSTVDARIVAFEKSGYANILLGMRKSSLEYVKELSKDMTKLPKERSLATSKDYLQRMTKSRPNSFLNIYFSVEDIDVSLEKFLKSLNIPFLDNYQNNLTLNKMSKMCKYVIVDAYILADKIGLSHCAEYIDGSADLISGKYEMSDLIKKIPGEILLFFYMRSNVDIIDKEIIDRFEKSLASEKIGIDIKEATGKSLYEVIQMFSGEVGFSVTDTKGIFSSNALLILGLKDSREFEEIIVSVSNYLSKRMGSTFENEDGIYSIPMKGFIRPIFTIKDDTLIFTFNKNYLERLYESQELTSDKIKSDGMKEYFNLKDTSSLFHLNFERVGDISRFIFGESKGVDMVKELISEFNGYSDMKKESSHGELEIVFSKNDFLPDLYKLISEILIVSGLISVE